MKRSLWMSGVMIVLLTSILSTTDRARAQDDEMMAAMQAAATPGEFHKKLAPMAGTFSAKTKMWMAPGQPATEAEYTSRSEWVLGGRFLKQQFEGNFMGMPFEGIGYVGYDNIQKKYVSTWIDTMGTGIMAAEGSLKPDGTIEFNAQYPDPVSGEMAKYREVYHFVDNDHHWFEMFGPGPDGKEYRTMEARYVRKK